MEKLLDLKVSVNTVDNKYENILHKAARMRNLDAIKFLIEGKFKLNVDATNTSYETPLVIALSQMSNRLVQKEKGGNIIFLRYI